jgi:hypothetical protein
MGAVAELAASQHGVFTRSQAVDRGITSRQLKSLCALSLFDEPVRGVLRVRATPPTWHQQLLIATLAPPGFYAAFRAAAFLHRLDGFHDPPTPEIIGPRGCRRIGGIDVIQHWVEPLDPDDLVVIDGIPCTGLARTVVDVCGLGDRNRSMRVFDDFERRGGSLNWLRMTTQRRRVRVARPAAAGRPGARFVVRAIGRPLPTHARLAALGTSTRGSRCRRARRRAPRSGVPNTAARRRGAQQAVSLRAMPRGPRSATRQPRCRRRLGHHLRRLVRHRTAGRRRQNHREHRPPSCHAARCATPVEALKRRSAVTSDAL